MDPFIIGIWVEKIQLEPEIKVLQSQEWLG
jgi:hypothetical protein